MWYPTPDNHYGQLPAPAALLRRQVAAESYVPNDGLADAINVSLALRKPLLLAGEPGVGKSTVAYHLAWALGLPPPHVFNTKSTSSFRDLFYAFDVVSRLRDAQAGVTRGAENYISLGPLGRAIYDAQDKVNLNTPNSIERLPPHLSVVLIDELDKAPRDFPNDFLHELEYPSFRIRELGDVEVVADTPLVPVTVITYNAEKLLPDPFLRRCVFHTIPFPSESELKEIVKKTFGLKDEEIESAISVFLRIRASPRIEKRPGLGELFDWLRVLQLFEVSVHGSRLSLQRTISSLVKTTEDQLYVGYLLSES
jgi:MoxR-like ATPase